VALPSAARLALAGVALGGLAAALAVWAEAAQVVLVPAAIVLGGVFGWLLDRRFERPVRRLARRLRGDGGAAVTGFRACFHSISLADGRHGGPSLRGIRRHTIRRLRRELHIEGIDDGRFHPPDPDPTAARNTL